LEAIFFHFFQELRDASLLRLAFPIGAAMDKLCDIGEEIPYVGCYSRSVFSVVLL
jgi:hypothetical protein